MHVTDPSTADPPAAPSAAGAAVQPLGRVLSIGGSQALVQIFTDSPAYAENGAVTVGSFIGIPSERSVVIGVLSELTSQDESGEQPLARACGRVDLLGEIPSNDTGVGRFRRGVTAYPRIDSPIVAVGAVGLQLIFDAAGPDTITVGHLQQDGTIGAHVNVEQMVRKHFAVFGSTGAGKSSAVAVVLREILAARSDLRIMLIDPHNEYGRCFGERAHVVGPGNLRLPFWLFNFDELVEVVFGSRRDVEDEIALLSELVPLAKGDFARSHTASRVNYRQLVPDGTGFTVDTPVPYRMEDLVALIESRIGKLENNGIATRYQRLLARINTARRNPRYAFIFNDVKDSGDPMADVLCRLLRLEADGRPMTVYQLAGFPAEVFDPVVSVLFRTAFEFGVWSEGAVPQLVVCEEAHHYAHADRGLGFRPAREALARIAKEGRKHGVYLGLVTQRPAELDPTLISQCSTVFAMRMANKSDQEIIRSAVSEAGSRLLDFLPSLCTREALIFGEGVPVLTRLRFKELPPEFVPERSEVRHRRGRAGGRLDKAFLAEVVERWRGGKANSRATAAAPLAPATPATALAWSVPGERATAIRSG